MERAYWISGLGSLPTKRPDEQGTGDLSTIKLEPAYFNSADLAFNTSMFNFTFTIPIGWNRFDLSIAA